MPEELVKKIDWHSKTLGSNRSDFIRQAVHKQLVVLDQWELLAGVVRADYKGPQLNETQVADLIRADRASQA